MILEGVKSAYEVGDRVAATDTYRLYLAKEISTGMGCLLQIARSFEHNGGLSRASFILDELMETACLYDTLYGEKHDGKRLHYDRLFPNNIESFIAKSQANRRTNILAFSDVTDVGTLLPLSNLRVKDRVMLDLKSGAWVMGRLLKLLDFAHGQGIAVRSLRPNNILLQPSEHFAIVLDWSTAQVFQNEIDPVVATADIVRAADAVLASCGLNNDQAPYQLNGEEERFVAMLRDFADASESNAKQAHARFYQTTREIWEPSFHPFTTLPLR